MVQKETTESICSFIVFVYHLFAGFAQVLCPHATLGKIPAKPVARIKQGIKPLFLVAGHPSEVQEAQP